MRSFKSQSGFSLLEVTFVLGLMAFGYTLFIQSQSVQTEELKARQIGAKLHEYQTATRRFATINAGNPDFIDTASAEIGSHWLKNQNECAVPAGQDAATGDVGLISCDFDDLLISGWPNSVFVTSIERGNENTPLQLTTIVDATSLTAGGQEIGFLDDSVLALSAITASGGSFASALTIDGQATTSVEPYMSSSSSKIIYCQMGLDDALLDPACTIGGDVRKGIFVLQTEAYPSNDIWIRGDGGNTMNNTFTFNEETPDEFREIANVNRLYNITGEFLKLGNSGVFDDDNPDWTPVLGSGVVIDTDAKIVGNIVVDGDIETKGEIYAQGDVISEGFLYANDGISTLGDVDVAGNSVVLGSGLFQNGLNVIGETSTDTAYVNSFLEAQEVYSRGNVYADTAVSAPYVRASVSLFSDGDLLVARDSFIGGNQYVTEDAFITGSVYADGDLIANEGSSYLSTVFADVIFDNNGSYLLDPSDISRVNIMRANRYAAGTPGGAMNVNANSVLFAAEDDTCTAGSAECATSLEGYWDLERLYVKRESTDEWIRLVDWMSEMQTTTEQVDQNLDEVINDYEDNFDRDYLDCWDIPSGRIYRGQRQNGQVCP